jgi:hypothetical protein
MVVKVVIAILALLFLVSEVILACTDFKQILKLVAKLVSVTKNQIVLSL